MELTDIRMKDSFGGELIASSESKSHGITNHLYEYILEKLNLDPSKLKLGEEFEGKIKFKIDSLAANCVGIEITHIGIEQPEKGKEFMSSTL